MDSDLVSQFVLAIHGNIRLFLPILLAFSHRKKDVEQRLIFELAPIAIVAKDHRPSRHCSSIRQ